MRKFTIWTAGCAAFTTLTAAITVTFQHNILSIIFGAVAFITFITWLLMSAVGADRRWWD